MTYLCFDTAINGNFTLLLLQKEYPIHQCLFQDTKDVGIWDVAPWLFVTENNVFKKIEHPLASLQHVVFFECDANIDELRQHLQYFIYKKIKDKEYFFRFWDARVLTKYLEGCSTKELQSFFGDTINMIRVTNENPDELVSLSINKKNKLEKKLVSKTAFSADANNPVRVLQKDPFIVNSPDDKKEKKT